MSDERHSRLVDGRRHYYRTKRLWALASVLPVTDVPIDDIAEFDKDCWFDGIVPTCRQVADHARRIQSADLAYPVILSATGALMDGGHRIAKAWLLGRSVYKPCGSPSIRSQTGSSTAIDDEYRVTNSRRGVSRRTRGGACQSA
jgi:hypothetical protein